MPKNPREELRKQQAKAKPKPPKKKEAARSSKEWKEMHDEVLAENGPLCPYCLQPNDLVLETIDPTADMEDPSNFNVTCRRCMWMVTRMEKGEPLDDLVVDLDYDQFMLNLVEEGK